MAKSLKPKLQGGGKKKSPLWKLSSIKQDIPIEELNRQPRSSLILL